jgi:REP element-mobilizing transposase RayT
MTPRRDVVDPSVVQIFHVFNRCVRRAFLCGCDAITGQDYSHRKSWLQNRMEFLAGIFAFDIATFAIMSNHFHLVLRSRPDIVAAWSDHDVVWRNLKLQGKAWFREDGAERKSTAREIGRILDDPVEVERIRGKLSDLSFLMSYFDEHIAKKSNREDGVQGAFWEGTYGCELIEDENSLLACMAYVDLNPIRAMLAQSLEESDFTGAFERIHELRQQLAIGEPDIETDRRASSQDASSQADSTDFRPIANSTLNWERQNHERIGWLAPVEIEPTGSGLDLDSFGRRPSRKGFLPISLLKYLEVVEWAGRQMRPDKRGSIPDTLAPVFERVGFTSSGFLESMLHFAVKEKYFESTERQGQPERHITPELVVA